MPKRPLAIVSFSGIDGAGKSTQIEELKAWLTQSGLRVTIFSMWDDVVVAGRWREFASHRAFGGDQGIGSPEKPLERRDKNVSSGPLELIRLGLYFADALSLWFFVRRLQRANELDVVIFDRYIYDELANLHLKPIARFVTRLIVKVTPTPDLALILDTPPEIARSRKPEYPLEFLHRNREAYFRLRESVPGLTIVVNSSVEETASKIRSALLPVLSRSSRPSATRFLAMLP